LHRVASTGCRTIDANEAVARIAYALNEVIAIYPITPAPPMGAAKKLLGQAQAEVQARRTFYEFLSIQKFNPFSIA